MASIVSDEMNESVDLSDEMNESVDLSNLKQKMLAQLVLNNDILKHWTINEYLNNNKTPDVKSYERHLNSVINLTLSSLDNMGLISIKGGQKGGAYSIKVYVIAVILSALYGVLDYGQTHQITLAVKMMDEQFDNISKELETSAPHTSFVLKNIMGKIGTCDYYNPVSTKFESKKILTSQLMLNDDILQKNIKTITNAIVAFKPVESKKAPIDLTKVSKSLDCQVSNVITAIEADAMLSVRDILQDTEIVDPTIWDKISTGFGLLENPTATAVNLMDKVQFIGTQAARRLTIKQQTTSVLTSKFNIVLSNINQIVTNNAVVVTNLGLVKKVIYGISIAGVKAVTGASVDSMALLVPTDIPSAITTAQSTAIVEAIKMISLPLTYAIMDGTTPSEIEDKKGGRKKGRRTKKRKVMKGGLGDNTYVIENNEKQLTQFEKNVYKNEKMLRTLQTIRGSGMNGGYWIIDVFNNNGEQGILLGFQEEPPTSRGQQEPPTSRGQQGGRKKKTIKGKKSKKNKTKKGKKGKKKGKKKTKKKRR